MSLTNKIAGLPINRRVHAFGTAPTTENRIYAFLATTGRPQVMEFEDSEDGHKQLADVIRCETVLAVIRGTSVSFELESVVNLRIRGELHSDRLSISTGKL